MPDIQHVDLGLGTGPMRIDAAADGSIRIAESDANRIARYDPAGRTLGTFPMTTFGAQPRFVAVGPTEPTVVSPNGAGMRSARSIPPPVR
jgi:streptogramin lyase